MRHYAAAGILLALSSQAFGQSYSENWTGTWKLDIDKSTFGLILFPGVPPGMTIVGQTLKIERADQNIRLSGESAVKLSKNVISNPEDTSLRLNGDETNLGPAVLAFRPVNPFEFEILSRLQVKDTKYQEVSRFVFSTDGKTLTETKTQTQRAVAPDGGGKAKVASIRSSTTVLIFVRAN